MPAEPCRHLTSALNDSMKTAIILFGNNTYYVIMLLLMLKFFWSQYKCIKETNYVLDNWSKDRDVHLHPFDLLDWPRVSSLQPGGGPLNLLSFPPPWLQVWRPAPATALLKKLCVGREQIFLQLAALIECRPVQGGPPPGHLYLTYF